jgi:hypothetical protein
MSTAATVPASRANPVIVAEMTVRSLVRRRVSMAILIALPLMLYVARHDHVGQSIRGLLFGVSWAVTTVVYFAATATWDAEPRLCLGGWSWRRLLGGRVAGLLALGWVLAAAYVVLVLLDQPVADPVALVVDFAVTAPVSVALGTALGALFHRELEGALMIFLIAGLQSVVNPDTVLAHLIPFWSSREIGTYAIDGPDFASLRSGVLHAAVVVVICGAVSFIALHRRLDVSSSSRRRTHLGGG